MSKQILLLAMCCAFQASNAMDNNLVGKQPENRLYQFINYVRQQGEQHQQEWLKGYHSHLQQVPQPTAVPVDQKKNTNSDK